MLRYPAHPFLTMIAILVSVAGYSQPATNILGKWKGEDQKKPLQIEIFPAKNGTYYGQVINDNNSPSKNGTIALKSLVYNEKAKNYKGTMQPPDAGITLNVTITMEKPDRLKLVASKLLMSKTMYLNRLN